jgi:hypothetical protein
MGLIICILENMQGKLDQDLHQIVNFLTEELKFLGTIESKASKFKSTILQAIAMAFAYNASATF